MATTTIKAGTMVQAKTTFAGRDAEGVLHSHHPKSDPFPLPKGVDWAESGVDFVESAELAGKRTRAQSRELSQMEKRLGALEDENAKLKAAAK